MKIGSLFSGVGGLDLACEWAGLGSTAWQLDLPGIGSVVRRRQWPDAVQVESDVRHVDPNDLPAVDVLAGGFSCKGVSTAGNRLLLGHPETRATYFGLLTFAGAVPSQLPWDHENADGMTLKIRVADRRWLPEIVVIENTPAMLTRMRTMMDLHFAALGYTLTFVRCRALDVGTPHIRARVFALAVRGGRGGGVVDASREGSWTPERDERTWATYTASEAKGRRTSIGRRDDPDMLSEQVRPWPTPRAKDWKGPDHARGENRSGLRHAGDDLATAVAEGAAARPWPTPTSGDAKASGSRSLDSDAHAGTSLTDAVRPDRSVAEDRRTRPWPTPTGSNPNEGEDPASHAARSAALVGAGSSPVSEPLGLAVRPWPTATTRDHKVGSGLDRGAPPLSEVAAPTGGRGRRLDPEWVETLMGFPVGWTVPDGAVLEAAPSPRWPRGRYPAAWDRSQVWPGYDWEPDRTLPDGPPAPGRPARLRALGNAVVPQQGRLAIKIGLGRSE